MRNLSFFESFDGGGLQTRYQFALAGVVWSKNRGEYRDDEYEDSKRSGRPTRPCCALKRLKKLIFFLEFLPAMLILSSLISYTRIDHAYRISMSKFSKQTNTPQRTLLSVKAGSPDCGFVSEMRWPSPGQRIRLQQLRSATDLLSIVGTIIVMAAVMMFLRACLKSMTGFPNALCPGRQHVVRTKLLHHFKADDLIQLAHRSERQCYSRKYNMLPSSYADVGSQPSDTANTSISIRPIQNGGSEMPTSDVVVTIRSVKSPACKPRLRQEE